MPTAPHRIPGRLPAGVWVLGFVSLLADVASEMVHSLLPLFLVGTVGSGRRGTLLRSCPPTSPFGLGLLLHFAPQRASPA